MPNFLNLLLALAAATSLASASVIQTRDEKPDFNKPFHLTVWGDCKNEGCLEDGKPTMSFTQMKPDKSKTITNVLDFLDSEEKRDDGQVVGMIEFQSASDEAKRVWIDDDKLDLHVQVSAFPNRLIVHQLKCNLQCDITINANTESTEDFLNWDLYSVKLDPGVDTPTDMNNGAWKATCKWT
jgi:hypothetical protein